MADDTNTQVLALSADPGTAIVPGIKTMAGGSKELFSTEPQSPDVGIYGTPSLLFDLAHTGGLLPPWWSFMRDAELRRFWKRVDHLAGAMYNMTSKLLTIPISIRAYDRRNLEHVELAAQIEDMLQMSCYSRANWAAQGWDAMLGPALEDYYGTDNGMFIVVEGPGPADGPLLDTPTALVQLDSQQCTRTRNRTYPVVYTDLDGKRYKIHTSRIMAESSLPSPQVWMSGVGFSAISRCTTAARHLYDIAIYESEKLGSRPVRQIVWGTGISAEQLKLAFRAADEAMDNAGLRRYAKQVYIGSIQQGLTLNTLPLSSVPDGYNKNEATTLGMYIIALAFGVDARELWPATQSGATKADATIQHMKARGKGPGQVLSMLTRQLQMKVLPVYLEAVFDFHDDEEDRARAEVETARAGIRAANIQSGVTNVRTERERALEDGDLTEAQFEALELADGRLGDGSDVLSMFAKAKAGEDEALATLLDLGVENPTNVRGNDAEAMLETIAAKEAEASLAEYSESTEEAAAAGEALIALKRLKSLYENKAQAALPTLPTGAVKPAGKSFSLGGKGGEALLKSRLTVQAQELVAAGVAASVPFADTKGGAGSGNWGHAGRPGEVGGSQPGGSGGSETSPVPGLPADMIHSDDSSVASSHLSALAKFPKELMERMVQAGFKGVYTGAVPFTQLDNNQQWIGVKPRGWPDGYTYDNIAGAAKPDGTEVYVGKGESGGANLALHEFGHCVGARLGYNESPEMAIHHARLYDTGKLDPYLRQGGRSGKIGVQETFAEGVSYTLTNRSFAVRMFDEPFVKYIESTIGVGR